MLIKNHKTVDLSGIAVDLSFDENTKIITLKNPKMPSHLRGVGRLFTKGGCALQSFCYPQLTSTRIFLRGSNRNYDASPATFLGTKIDFDRYSAVLAAAGLRLTTSIIPASPRSPAAPDSIPCLDDFYTPRLLPTILREDDGLLGWHFCHPRSTPVCPEDAQADRYCVPAPGYCYGNSGPSYLPECCSHGMHSEPILKEALTWFRSAYFHTRPRSLATDLRRSPLLCRTLSYGRVSDRSNSREKFAAEYRIILWTFNIDKARPRYPDYRLSAPLLRDLIRANPHLIKIAPWYDAFFIPAHYPHKPSM